MQQLLFFPSLNDTIEALLDSSYTLSIFIAVTAFKKVYDTPLPPTHCPDLK